CGTHSLTCGAISSSGSFSNGTNSMTTGAITSSGRIVCQQGRPLCVLSSFGLGTEIKNTNLETNIMGPGIGGTLPANSVVVGSIIKIQCYASFNILGTTNLRLRVYLGGT